MLPKEMNGTERMAKAMKLEKPDRVPLMCQPSWGFVLKQLPWLNPVDLWHNRERAYAEAFCKISRRFHFDGVLIPGVGLAPLDEDKVKSIGSGHEDGPVVHFKNGDSCVYCHDDLPRYQHAVPPEVTIDDLDPDKVPDNITFLPPSNRLRMWLNTDPYGRVAEIHQSKEITCGSLSIHGSVYAPEDYLIDRLGIQGAFMAMMTHPDKCKALLLRYAQASCVHVGEQIDAGADAINFSAPWTGQNFISREMFEEIIAPAHRVVATFCRERETPCYCHTCGSIGDRLELIIDIGFSGLECLDPPPLGNVELDDAVRRIGHRASIKGNIDPVNVLMNGTPAQVRKDAIRRLETGMKSEGFILSTACSIAPGTPAQNLDVLIEVVEKYGYY
jgi:hypothetical protein